MTQTETTTEVVVPTTITPEGSLAAIATSNFLYFVPFFNAKRGHIIGKTIVWATMSEDNRYMHYSIQPVWGQTMNWLKAWIFTQDYLDMINACLIPIEQIGRCYTGKSPSYLTKKYRGLGVAWRTSTCPASSILLGYAPQWTKIWQIFMSILRPDFRKTQYDLQLLIDWQDIPYDKAKIKKRMEWDWEDEAFESLMESIKKFQFIRDVDIDGQVIEVLFKAPIIDMWIFDGKPVKMRWFPLTLRIDLFAREINHMYTFKQIPWHAQPLCCHVSSNGSMCFWTFAAYSQKNKSDIKSAIMHFREHLNTFNPNSPIFRPSYFFHSETGNIIDKYFLTMKQKYWTFWNIIRGKEEMELTKYISENKEKDWFYDQMLFS